MSCFPEGMNPTENFGDYYVKHHGRVLRLRITQNKGRHLNVLRSFGYSSSPYNPMDGSLHEPQGSLYEKINH